MGIYRVTNGSVGKALPITATDTITSPSAWLFENQTGILGNNLTGSLIYSGSGGNISVILADTIGEQGVVTSLNTDSTFTGANPYYTGFVAGSGYVTEAGINTTTVTTVPNSPATVPGGLSVDITVVMPTTNALTPGTGYSVNAFTVAEAGGLSGNILTLGAGGAIATFEITDGGVDYKAGDVLTIVQTGGTGGSITLAAAPNGAVSADAITITAGKAGVNYSIGDIITITQGTNVSAKFCIRAVKNNLPVIADAVVFEAVPAGTILPVAVNYVTATGTVATGLIACK
jgi:hypothetical protein